jgi:hypothetical protein
MSDAMLDGDTNSVVAGWRLDVSEGWLEYHCSADGCQTEARVGADAFSEVKLRYFNGR